YAKKKKLIIMLYTRISTFNKLGNFIDRKEAELVEEIVGRVVGELSSTNLFITDYPVGINSRVKEIRVLLEKSDGSANDVRIIGICGIGGISKTTTAKAIYNQYFHSFEAKSFLENVREVSQQHKGMEQLQEQFLSDVFRTMEVKIHTVARGLKLTLPRGDDRIVETKAFWELQNLRLLQFSHVKFKTGYEEDLFEELRWLYWHDFPLEFLPNEFHLGKVVIVDMQHSNLRQVWKNPKFLRKLKFLDLSHSQHLKETPDFSQLPNLKELKLKGCTSLVELHHSLPQLGELVYADFEDCKLLESLPRDFGELKSLKTLVLDCCSKLHTYPENMGDLKSLTTFRAKNTAVGLLPDSFSQLKKLKNISLSGNFRFMEGESLKKSNLLPHSLKGFSLLSLLSFLNLSPSFLSHDHLSMEKWHQLIHKAQGSNLHNSSSSRLLLMPVEHVLTHDFLQGGKVLQVIQELHSHAWNGIFVHGDQIPDKYIYRQEGPSVDVDVPDDGIDSLLYGLEVCCVYSCDADYVASPDSHLTIHFTNYYTKDEVTFMFKAIPNSEHYLKVAFLLGEDIGMAPGDKLRIQIKLGNKIKVKTTGAVFMTLDCLDLEQAMRRTMDDQWDNIYECIKEMVAFLRGDGLVKITDRQSKKFEVNEVIGSCEAATARDAFTSSSSRKSLLGAIRPPSEAAHERSSAPYSTTGKLMEKMVDLMSISSAKGLAEPMGKGEKGKAKEKEAEILQQEESEKASSRSNFANPTTIESANLKEASHVEILEREEKLDRKKRLWNGVRRGRGGWRSCCCSWWSRPA
ncbi:hypothetical protein Tsubulata_021921, partial [Turnera subulata]